MSRRYTYEDVKAYVSENSNDTLISKTYKNNKASLEFMCSKNHKYFMPFDCFKNKGYRCSRCAGNGKYTYEEVKQLVEADGTTLLSPEYVNSKTLLEFMCPKNHKYQNTFSHFNSGGQRCPTCAGVAKYTVEQARQIFLAASFIPLFDKYVDAHSLLKYMCSKLHVGYISLASFLQKPKCSACAGNRRYTVEQAKQIFVDRGCIPLFEEYINAHILLKYKCPKKHICYITLHNFLQGHGCKKCSSGNISQIGENWLDTLNISNLEREYPIAINGKKYSVDGYSKETNTVYEFLGDFWHGNPARFNPKDINLRSKKSYGQLHKETFERIAILESAGYNVVYIWEKDFREQ
jgi:hypothetical protein